MSFYTQIPYSLSRFFVPLTILGLLLIFFGTACSDSRTDLGKGGDFSELKRLFEEADKKTEPGNVSPCIQFIDSAIAGKELNVREKFKVLTFKSAVYFYAKDSANTMVFADSMLRLIEQSGEENYNEEYALANYSKGDVLFYEKRFDEAYKYYFKARHIGKSTVDLCTMSEYSYRIGMILFQQSRFLEAAENFQNAFGESESCSFDFSSYYRRQEVLNNIALSFSRAGKADSALFYCRKALEYVTKHDGKFKDKENLNEIAKAVIYENEGEILKGQGFYNKAEERFKKCIEINTKKGYDNKNAQYSQLNLAEVYFLTNRLDSMALLLKQARLNLDSIPNNLAEIDWNRLMWKYNESKHDLANSFKYLKHYTSLKDSTTNANNKLNQYNASEQVKMLENQYKINSLQKENKLQNLYLLICLITTASGLVIFLFSLFILRNTRNKNEVLKGLNKQIEDQKLELQETLFELEERNKEKDRILRGVAHDLRTPAASISMLSDLILTESNDQVKTEMLKLVKSSSDNAIALISEILESADANINSKLEKQKVEVNKLLEEAVSQLRLKASEKQQTIRLEFLNGDENFSGNKEKIHRVISNLVSNSIKFSERKAEILVKAIKKENAVQIVVHDNGIGIPENLKNKVFDMFTEAKRAGTAGEKPFGLGLSICRQIVEAHNGEIWFESEQGKGTKFFIQFNNN